MPQQKPETEMFEIAARGLCPGNEWQAAIADLMQIRRDSVRHLRSGRMPLKPGHFETLLRLIAERRVEFDRIEADLRAWLERNRLQSPAEARTEKGSENRGQRPLKS
jgi:hypothetical protein